MAGESVREVVENACAENRAFGEVIRRLEGLHGSRPPFDWAESRPWCAEVLAACYDQSESSKKLAARLLGTEYEVGGDEHHLVRLDDEVRRVFKITHGDAFGCYSYFSPYDPDLKGRHFHGSINEDPVFYLRRWMLLNFLGGYRTKFEGLLPPQEGHRFHRLCVSQPILEGENPSRRDILRSLEEYGFENISEDAFFQSETTILLTDAAPRNVRIVEGVAVPFDAIATLASDKVLSWLETGR